jgi:Ca-activated chloride channel family protein
MQADDSDLNYLLAHIDEPSADLDAEIETTYDSWHDAGYWLIILLIPLALMSFRRDFLFSLPVIMLVALATPRAEAGIWQDLWLTKDQQAQHALEDGDAITASELFEATDWKAYANYQASEFETATGLLTQSETSSLYNLGTSQARAGQLEEALENLNQFVEQNPDHENARFNRDLVEQLLQQQEQQEQEQQNQQAGSGESDQSETGDEQDSQPDDGSQSAEDSESAEGSQQAEDSESADGSQQADGSEQSEPEEGEQQQASAGASEQQENSGEQETMAELAEVSPEDLSDSSEQWLRAIPDDPSGLLRRKFEYESQLYQQQRRFLPPNPGQNEEPRY